MSLLRGAVGLTNVTLTGAAMRLGTIVPTYYAQVLWFQ